MTDKTIAAAKKSVRKTTAKKVTATKKRAVGQPPAYSDEIADIICKRISNGESLNKICQEPDMPSQSMVYRWLADDRYAIFREKYAQARDEQASLFAAQIVEISDEEPRTYIDEGGNARVDAGYVQYQRVRIDARKWYASKVAPKKYGDKVDLNVGGQKDNPLSVLYEQISGKGFAPDNDDE